MPATGIDPRVDYAFKRLFGSEENALLLVDLLNRVANPPGAPVAGVRIRNPFTQKDYAEEKVSVFDVLASDDPGRCFHLEMQRVVPVSFIKRALYYWAVAYRDQLRQGEAYLALQPTYSICFLDDTLFAKDQHWHHTFGLYDRERDVDLPSDLAIHVIELPKLTLAVEQVKTQLERWCWFMRNGASLDPDSLPATMDVPEIRKAVEVLMRLGQDEQERQWYEDRQRAERDRISEQLARRDAEQARQDAERRAEQGLEKGERIGSIRRLQKWLKQPQTPKEALREMTLGDLIRLEETLEEQLEANGAKGDSSPTAS